MYVLVVYDVNVKRVVKVLKYLRKHLNWIQNSVFEGSITDAQLYIIKNKIREITEPEDSIIFFIARDEKWIKKEIIGREKNPTSNFL
ncbi:MAG: CRISPR-associated endonuclease Cas2 [Alkaliphilus sp.]|nr:CRISPR-associated endonuclease Cas2 [bacterium AH-315-E09]PHS35844.1 MAG: CRISPR-associated endonuclease Cas2 [Alkaliphilus sp.]